jgi:hypothetical protein
VQAPLTTGSGRSAHDPVSGMGQTRLSRLAGRMAAYRSIPDFRANHVTATEDDGGRNDALDVSRKNIAAGPIPPYTPLAGEERDSDQRTMGWVRDPDVTWL